MKSIQSRQDLVINGATPAFEHPLHVGSPNIVDRQAFLKYVGEIFDRDWLSNNGPMVKVFEQRVADYHDVKQCKAR